MPKFNLVVHATVEYMNDYTVEVEADSLAEAAEKAATGVDYERVEKDVPTITRYGQIYEDQGDCQIDDSKPLVEF